MRHNLNLAGTAVGKLKGNVEHALKVVGGPDIFEELQGPHGYAQPGIAVHGPHTQPQPTVQGGCSVPAIPVQQRPRERAMPTYGPSVVQGPPAHSAFVPAGTPVTPTGAPVTVNGGCWQYADTNGLPVIMDRIYPHANPHVGYPASSCQCACPAKPAGPGLHSEDEPRKGVLREDHYPQGREPDPRVEWMSGFMPVDPNFIRQFMPHGQQMHPSWTQQLMPSWFAAHGRQPFNCGPQANVG